MSSESDRIPIRVGPAASVGPDSYVLFESDMPAGAPLHVAGCACCAPRSALARALARLFMARARGEVTYFREVVVVGDKATLTAALDDVVVAARFRPG